MHKSCIFFKVQLHLGALSQAQKLIVLYYITIIVVFAIFSKQSYWDTGYRYFTKELLSEIFSSPLRAKINCDAKERQVRALFAQILNRALGALVLRVLEGYPSIYTSLPFFGPRSDHSLRMSTTD